MIDDLFRLKSKIDTFFVPIFKILTRFISKNIKLYHHKFLVV
jgi:hypothetical protein